MHTTSYFKGQKLGDFNYLFFYITSETIQRNKKITETLDPLIEAFAENLDNFGAVKKPFAGKEEATYNDALNKGWAHHELVNKLPTILVTNVDFDKFHRKTNKYLLISLRESITETGEVKVFEIEEILNEMVYGSMIDDLFSIMDNYFLHKKRDARSLPKAIWDALSAITFIPGFEFDPKKFLSFKELNNRLKDNNLS